MSLGAQRSAEGEVVDVERRVTIGHQEDVVEMRGCATQRAARAERLALADDAVLCATHGDARVRRFHRLAEMASRKHDVCDPVEQDILDQRIEKARLASDG